MNETRDSEKICEVEVEGHGLVEIVREGKSFSGRIRERMGPFSRDTTVPLCCKGFRDPAEAMRDLARLPCSALSRRIHILADRSHVMQKFIYVGDLGLRGGGDRQPPRTTGPVTRSQTRLAATTTQEPQEMTPPTTQEPPTTTGPVTRSRSRLVPTTTQEPQETTGPVTRSRSLGRDRAEASRGLGRAEAS